MKTERSGNESGNDLSQNWRINSIRIEMGSAALAGLLFAIAVDRVQNEDPVGTVVSGLLALYSLYAGVDRVIDRQEYEKLVADPKK